MTTIAELQIKVDSTQAERGTKVLNDLAAAADKAAKARKALNDAQQGGNGGGGGGGGADDDVQARKAKNLSEAIDAQTRKLAGLTAQRKLLNESNMKTENPEEYKRLSREIDARTELVRRQGNSLDRLAQQANREAKAREAATKAAKDLAERETKQLEAREAMQARFAAAQQKNLDATIAGLSRQVKAQQDYNKTIETLSLSRFEGRLSGAEFDTYAKRAAAIRDESLARIDNTKELERNQRQLDSVTATLGKAERAEFQYQRSVSVLNDALKLGRINADQYAASLAAHTTKRDNAINAANNNAAAEARIASALQNVLGAYDPVIRATDQYNAAVRVLSQGLQTGQVTVQQFNKALSEQRAALDNVKAAQTGTVENSAKQYQAAIDRLLPYNVQLRNLAEAERVLTQQKAAGKVTTDQQIADYDKATRAIAAERAEIERRNAAERRGNSAKQDAAALRGLPAQFTDVVVSLQGGQAPLTVLLQQGGQVKDMFGGILPAIKAVGGALISMVNPATIAGAALVSFGLILHAGAAEATEFNKAIAASGGYSGASADSFLVLQKSISSVVGTMGIAADALVAMQKSGKISVEQFEAIGIAAVKMQRTTGQAVGDTVAEFASLGKDPTNAVVTLNDKYRFLTSSVYEQIAAMQRQGDIVGATTLAQQEMAKGVQEMADNIKVNLGAIETGWKFVSEAAKGAWDAMLDVNRAQSIDDQIKNTTKLLADRKTGLLGWLNLDSLSENSQSTNFLKERLKILENFKKSEEAAAKATSDRTKAEEAAVAGQRVQDRVMLANQSQAERLTKQLDEVRFAFAGVAAEAQLKGVNVGKSQLEQYVNNVADLEKKIKDAKDKEGKTPTKPVDTRELQEVKSNQAVIVSEYQAHYKKVTALGKANITSQEATFASQKAILQAEQKAVADSFDQQIASIKKLQGVKGNNAAQSISLDNQMTRAQADKLKADEGYVTKLEVLSTQEKGFLDKRTESIYAYNEALRQQIENVANAGKRATAAVGQGDRQGSLNDALAEADRQFAKDKMALSRQLSKGMDLEEYKEDLKNLTKAHDDMTKQIISNDKDLKEAEGEWTNGLTKALQNHIAEGQNVAKAMEQAFETAFDGMADGLTEFVTTGKLDFKSLVSSILGDLAKIAIRLAMNQALGAMFGGMGGGGGGWGGLIMAGVSAFSGGGNGMAAGSSGAMSSNLGASSAGYSNQFFAKGGAFTNSIVSSPTEFSMPGGKGTMGESGPEAIMPLARSSDGSLGVRMVGGGQASGGVQVYVNIQSDGSVETSTNEPGLAQFGKELGDFVDKRYQSLLARDLKDGGAIKTSMKNS